jgi:hypothetical protein
MKTVDSFVYLVNTFCLEFPDLGNPDIAEGRCKFYSYELVKYLKAHGINAELYHVQGISNYADWPNARKTWLDTDPDDWTHYVVVVNGVCIDVTSRQLDPNSQHPNIRPIKGLLQDWNIVERDIFLNDIAQEIHESDL